MSGVGGRDDDRVDIRSSEECFERRLGLDAELVRKAWCP